MAIFDSDLRTVKPEVGEHMMRPFLKHYSSQNEEIKIMDNCQSDPTNLALLIGNSKLSDIIYDEGAIDNR